METISLKKRIQRGDVVWGTFVKLDCPQVMEMLSMAGLDFAVLDMEHSNLGYSQMENLIRSAGKMDTVVRVPSALEEHILHGLDSGASGVQIPGLQSLAAVEEIAQYTKYAPEGKRGLSFAQRSAAYGLTDKNHYLQKSNEDVLRVVHIENRTMVEQADALCKSAAVDVVFIGPMDLSQSYGTPGDPKSEEVQKAVDCVIQTARSKGKAIGTFVSDLKELEDCVRKGIQYIVWSSDVAMFASAAKSYVKITEEAARKVAGSSEK